MCLWQVMTRVYNEYRDIRQTREDKMVSTPELSSDQSTAATLCCHPASPG